MERTSVSFRIYIGTRVLRLEGDETKEINIKGDKGPQLWKSSGTFADDSRIIAENEVDLQYILDRVESESTAAGLSIYRAKTKVIKVSRAGARIGETDI